MLKNTYHSSTQKTEASASGVQGQSQAISNFEVSRDHVSQKKSLNSVEQFSWKLELFPTEYFYNLEFSGLSFLHSLN